MMSAYHETRVFNRWKFDEERNVVRNNVTGTSKTTLNDSYLNIASSAVCLAVQLNGWSIVKQSIQQFINI